MLDSYEIKARVYPALLMFVPILVFVFAFMYDSWEVVQDFVASLVSLALIPFLSQLARDKGKEKQERLFAEMGRMPSAYIFEYSNSLINKKEKERMHQKMSNLTGIFSPGERGELENPNYAEEVYELWSEYLRKNTRDKDRFPLVFEENRNYGFRRNLWGVSLFVSILSFFVSLLILTKILFLYWSGMGVQQEKGILILLGGFSLLYALVFAFKVNREWVVRAAEMYALRLAESTDGL